MTLRERLAALDPAALVERLAADPPHRVALRAVRVALGTGTLRARVSSLMVWEL